MRLRIALIAATLAGCAAQPKPVVDTTPQNPTAVFETKVSSTGIAGMFPFETTETRYVRPTMRREDQSGKGTGTFSGFLMTRAMGNLPTTIERLDRRLRWTLDHGKKEYTECPVQGCPRPPREEKPAEAKREEPKQKTEEGCVAHLASSHFEVRPTGQKQVVNGFNTEEYRMAWVVRIQDQQKRTTTSTVNVDLWTTPVNAQMRRALDTESAFDRAYASAARQRFAGREGEVMPAQLMGQMTAYLASLRPTDRSALMRAAQQLNKVKGHPIQTRIDWLLEGNACGSKEEEKPAAQSGTAELVSSVTNLFGKKKEEKPSGPEPIVSFTVEVKQLGIAPVHDSVFAVPVDYKLVKPE